MFKNLKFTDVTFSKQQVNRIALCLAEGQAEDENMVIDFDLFDKLELGFDPDNGADLEPFWSPDDNQWMI